MKSQNENPANSPIFAINLPPVDLEQIKSEISVFLSHYPYEQNQVCLNDRNKSVSFDAYEGIGSALDDSQNKIKFYEHEFTRWSELLKETELLRQIRALESIGYPVGRARLMRLMPRSCYSFHRDDTKRIHLVVQPEPQAALLFPPDKILKVPQDCRFHLVDTTQLHSAMNGGLGERVHLVLALRH